MMPFTVRPGPAVMAVALLAAPNAAAAAPLHYRIDARLDTSRRVVSGRETITWTNGADEPRQLAICVTPGLAVAAADGRTRTIAPGATVALDLQWTVTLPPSAGDAVVGDHWYPRASVGAAGHDANCAPAPPGQTAPDDPADFEVSLTVPRGWLIAATGREAAMPDPVVGGPRRFLQRGVREFSWVTGPRYVERTRRVDGPPQSIDVRLLLAPEHVGQAERLLDAAVDALTQHRRWLSPYPRDLLTLVDTGWRDIANDRSYPGLVTFSTLAIVPSTTLTPETAVVSGISGQWWGSLVSLGPDDAPALTDGLRDYFTGMVVEHLFDVRHQRLSDSAFGQRYFGGFVPWAWRDVRIPRAAAYHTRGGRGFGTLERYLGTPAFQRALAAVVDRGSGPAMSGAEFFRVAGDAAGQDLRWFEEAVFGRAGAFDYAVKSVASAADAACNPVSCFRTTVVVERRGDGQFTGTSQPPIARYESGRALRLSVSFADGGHATATWDGRDQDKSVAFQSLAPATSVLVDPDRMLLLDSAWTNNSWTNRPAAGRAATRWSVTWAIWLEHVLLSYASLL